MKVPQWIIEEAKYIANGKGNFTWIAEEAEQEIRLKEQKIESLKRDIDSLRKQIEQSNLQRQEAVDFLNSIGETL